MTNETATNHRITDEEIAREITESLAWDSRLQRPHVRVTVHDGLVFLGGVVERFVEKEAAEEDAARLAGVVQVISNIAVQPERPITDGEIAESIRRALRRDCRVREERLDVSVTDGVATIRGEALTILEKQAAHDVASLTYGVAGLLDQVSVLPQEQTDGRSLAELVVAALERVPSLGGRRLEARIEGSKATLIGEVDFLYQLRDAEKAVSDVPGVGEVRSEIRVGQRAAHG